MEEPDFSRFAEIYKVGDSLGYDNVVCASRNKNCGNSQRAVAVKTCSSGYGALKEVAVYAAVTGHPNIVALFDVTFISGFASLIFEPYDCDLRQFLKGLPLVSAHHRPSPPNPKSKPTKPNDRAQPNHTASPTRLPAQPPSHPFPPTHQPSQVQTNGTFGKARSRELHIFTLTS